jgi:hypothetical protein
LPAPNPAPVSADEATRRDAIIAGIMGGLRKLQAEPDMPKRQRAVMRGQLVAALASVDDLAEAVLNDDMDAVISICGPTAQLRPELLAWATGDGTVDWLQKYLADVIAPALVEVMDAEDAEGEAEEAEDDGQAGVPALPAPAPVAASVIPAKSVAAPVPVVPAAAPPRAQAQPIPMAPPAPAAPPAAPERAPRARKPAQAPPAA